MKSLEGIACSIRGAAAVLKQLPLPCTPKTGEIQATFTTDRNARIAMECLDLAERDICKVNKFLEELTDNLLNLAKTKDPVAQVCKALANRLYEIRTGLVYRPSPPPLPPIKVQDLTLPTEPGDVPDLADDLFGPKPDHAPPKTIEDSSPIDNDSEPNEAPAVKSVNIATYDHDDMYAGYY